MSEVKGRPDVTAPLEDEPVRRRLLPRLSTLVVALLGLVAVGTLVARGVWLGHEEARFKELIDAAKTRGEPVTLADFAPATTLPAEQNAATFYLRAAQSGVSSWESNRGVWADPVERWKLLPDKLGPVEEMLEENAQPLRDMRAARAIKTAQWDVAPLADWRAPAGRALIDQLRDLPPLAELAARAAHARGDDRESLERLHDLFAFGRAMRQSRSLMSLVTGHGIEGFTADLLACAARETRFDRAAAQAMIEELLAPVDSMQAVRAMYAERATIASRMEAAMGSGEKVAWLRPMHWLARPYHVRRAGRHYEYVTLAAHAMGEMIISDARTSLRAWGTQPPAPWQRHIAGEPADIIAERALGGGYRPLVEQDRQLVAVRRLMAVTVAIALYRSDNGGKFPAKLEELTREYLPAVPRDPFRDDATPLLYRTAPDPCVWSVGTDGMDDSTPLFMALEWKPEVNWAGRDIEVYLDVKPPPATAPAAPADPNESFEGLPRTQEQ